MISGIRTIWFVITVIILGIVFYSIFTVLILDLGIEGNLFNTVLKQGEVSTAGLMIASGVVMQIMGIMMEKLEFKIGLFRHSKVTIKESEFDDLRKQVEEPKPTESGNEEKDKVTMDAYEKRTKEAENKIFQFAWDQRYNILATKTELDKSQVELRVALFFMSINIFVGMLIQLIWVVFFQIWIKTPLQNFSVTIVILVIVVCVSLYIPHYRFKHASSVLYEFYKSKKDEEKSINSNSYFL